MGIVKEFSPNQRGTLWGKNVQAINEKPPQQDRMGVGRKRGTGSLPIPLDLSREQDLEDWFGCGKDGVPEMRRDEDATYRFPC